MAFNPLFLLVALAVLIVLSAFCCLALARLEKAAN
jgi:hypothetical protein